MTRGGAAVAAVVCLVAAFAGGYASGHVDNSVCVAAVQQGSQVVDTTTSLGLAMVERAQTDEWLARSVATAEVEHLTATLEVEVPRYEELKGRCLR